MQRLTKVSACVKIAFKPKISLYAKPIAQTIISTNLSRSTRPQFLRCITTNIYGTGAPTIPSVVYAPDAPVTLEEFSSYIPSKINSFVVCVSGGPDSMALCYLAHQYAKANNKKMYAITVDHKLRPDSTREAQLTHSNIERLGIKHEILTIDWGGDPPLTGIQARSRDRRYSLIEQACKQYGAEYAFFGTLTDFLCSFSGHQAEDNAETFLMRVCAESGIDGLACMTSVGENAVFWKVKVIRPFISTPKSRLVATCKKNHIQYVNDPSNKSPNYTRNRIRELNEKYVLPVVPLNEILEVVKTCQDIKLMTSLIVDDYLAKEVFIGEQGYVAMNAPPLMRLGEALAYRIFYAVARFIRPDCSLGLDTDALRLLWQWFTSRDRARKSGSLKKVTFKYTSTDQVIIVTSWGVTNSQPSQPITVGGPPVLMDSRWEVTLRPYTTKTTVNKSTQYFLRKFNAKDKYKLLLAGKKGIFNKYGNTLHENIQFSLPAIVDGMDTVMAVPHFNYYHPNTNFRAYCHWKVKYPIPRDFQATEARLIENKLLKY